jgi:hypothetical protein
MTQGVVTGGWEFVAAAYGITIAALVIYGAALLRALRKSQ